MTRVLIPDRNYDKCPALGPSPTRPLLLGVWLAIGGFAYVILSLTGELLPQYQGKVFAYSQPAFFGELAIMLWLLIKGAKPPADATGSSLAG